MQVRLGVVMDPIGSIHFHKDSTLAMLLAAQKRGWELQYMEQGDLALQDGTAFAVMRSLTVTDDADKWYELSTPVFAPLDSLHVILMRKDPPWDMEYVYTTIMLARAEAAGVLVVNRAGALRDVNEKLFTAWFPQCCAPTLVTRDEDRLRNFLSEHGEMILKPLHGMGGESVFLLRQGDANTNVTIELLTDHGRRFTMAQKYLPEISRGDKRILVIDGEPVPYALARIPAAGESRGNLAAGGHGEGVALSERDRWICEQVAPTLREKGLWFVGLDVIGDYLTEINVTSPTCIRELDRIYGLNIAAQLMDCIEAKLEAPSA
ncbi:MAG: glutathione synthase [Gammaproteobacteria bacterium]